MFDRRLLLNFDLVLFLLIFLLSLSGFISIYSVSNYTSGGSVPLYQKELYFFLIGLGVMFFALLFHYHYLERYAYLIYSFSLLLLIAVLVFGRVSYGARRWLDMGFISFQPSEFAKIAVIIALSKYFYNRGIMDKGLDIKGLLPPFFIVFIPFVLVAVEPDLGTALILLFIFASIVAFAKVRLKTILTLGGVFIGSMPIFWRMLKDYQKERILAFLNPELDPLGLGYHIIQSKIAVGSGGFWGKGFLHGTQSKLKFLPAQHTDFIFSVFAEEWGFIGSLFLLILYLFLILWGLNIVRRSRDRFGAYLAFGIIAFIFWHVFINIGMVLGLFPVVGVPLPFLSYGGSFLVIVMLSMGILLNISMRRFMF